MPTPSAPSDAPAVTPSGLTAIEARILTSIQAEAATGLLQELIRRRSDYPPGDTREVVAFVARVLSEAGIPIEVLAKNPEQPSLLACLGDPDKSPRLVFHAHLDTVPAGDCSLWSMDPFEGELRHDQVFGRGAGDDKASAAAQVLAFLALKLSGVQMHGCLQLALVADEESGALHGTVWLRDQGNLKPDLLVVGEQTDNHIAIAERVACGIDLIVKGKGAHGAMPWAGENAVLKTARALAWLHERLFPVLTNHKHPYLPPATLNIGKISGGIQWNIVPDMCKVEMDRRLLPGETRDAAIEEIRQVLDEFAATVEPLEYELFSQGEVAPCVNTPAEHQFVRLALQALADAAGEYRSLSGYVQTSDGRWFAGGDLPIIIFGPSNPAVAHAPDEHVSVMQVVEAARFLALLALRQLACD